MRIYKITLAVFLLLTYGTLFSQGLISGELRKWHTIAVTFDGPATSENDANNPFLNYRLNVTFTGPNGQAFIVPGYFAGDGNAANTGANSGNKWRVLFTPNQIGQWNYVASFRSGANVAVSLIPTDGVPTSFDGTTGSFSVSASNKAVPDNRAKGRLNYVGESYLQYEETGDYFLKAGADSPENLMGYGEIDNTVNSKTWSPHVQDWNTGDPVWQGTKGKGLIGAINYLSSKGMNAYSFLTMNVIGDGKDVWPWAATSHDMLDDSFGADAENRTRYDVSKLAQWEIIMEHANSKGMYLHFKTQETENKNLLDASQLGVQRKLYYRELIARFGHHLALNWNLGEEFDIYNPDLIKSYATYIKAVDPYDHHIVIHSYAYPETQDALYLPLLGQNDLTGPSLQIFMNGIHEDVKRWVLASKNSGKNWVVANDEQGGYESGVTTDAAFYGDKGTQPDNRSDVRYKVLYATLMAGGAGVEYYFGYQTGETDLSAEDWRSRDSKWNDAKLAIDFFQEHLPFWDMESNDALTSSVDDYCFAQIGEIYAVYLPNGGSTNLNLTNTSGTFTVRWFNPQTGGALLSGSVAEINAGASVSIGNPPNSTSNDWVAVISKKEGTNGGGSGNQGCTADFEEQNGLVVIETENLNAPTGWNVKSDVAGFTGNGFLSWEGGNSFSVPGNGVISTAIKINDPGTYLFQWRTKVGEGTNPTESNDSWLRFPDASDFFGGKDNGSVVYPIGSGKSPVAHGSGADGWFKVNSSGTVAWTWTTYTNDNDGHFIYVTFNTPGIYTMEISGRSNHHLLDRIVLSKNVPNTTDLSLTETPCETPANNDIAVTDVNINPTNASMEIGSSLNLGFEVLPIDATNKLVSWSSNNDSVALVDQNGMVTALSEGSATITVTTSDGGFTAMAAITVNATEMEDPDPDTDPTPTSNCTSDFVAQNGLVVIEAENLAAPLGWETGTLVNGYTGSGYIGWENGDFFNSPGTGLITAQIEISEAGTYHFQWRTKVGNGTNSTEHNDSWLRFPDADDFYGAKASGSIVYPKGSGKTPLTAGSGADGWFKVNSSAAVSEWTWTTYTNDGDGHNIYVTFNSPGIYTMEISGRSTFHLIDRIVLGLEGTAATDLNIAETACTPEEEAEQEIGPTLQIENSSAIEGENIDFELLLTKASEEIIILDIEFVNQTTEAEDYIPSVESVTFNPGEVSKIVSVPTRDDDTQEENETFKIEVSEVQQGNVADFSDVAIGTIIDEDIPMRVFPNPAQSNGAVQLTGLQNGSYEIALFSMSGELIQSHVIDVDGNHEYRIGTMAKGLYILRAAGVERTYNSKLMVQ